MARCLSRLEKWRVVDKVNVIFRFLSHVNEGPAQVLRSLGHDAGTEQAVAHVQGRLSVKARLLNRVDRREEGAFVCSFRVPPLHLLAALEKRAPLALVRRLALRRQVFVLEDLVCRRLYGRAKAASYIFLALSTAQLKRLGQLTALRRGPRAVARRRART